LDSKGDLNRLNQYVLHRRCFTMLLKALQISLNRLADIPQRLFQRVSLGMTPFKGWAEGMIAPIFLSLQNDCIVPPFRNCLLLKLV
jgi:hypothetical protein